MQNLVLVVCDSNRTYSPLAAAILAKELSDHPVLRDWQVRSAGAFVGPSPQLSYAPLSSYAQTKGLSLGSAPARDINTEEIQLARFIIVCEPDTMELLRAQFNIENLHILFLPNYSTTRLYHRIPDPLLGELPVAEFFSVIQEATMNLYTQELKHITD